ncbi:hypothetical protein IQ249_16080 [Lusitaniella coriacea LEGE 07157]|uniref:Filament integrity protein n=1 Tax=Lusitaniella coriacea LEGE 07157 TaxID=945747 RepID=A0A8J7E1H1_9CYAN|nr:filament integrity protein FraC [Lusitaniella coriacea]MBE9117419.1 hypothetical protein [Lusitaniella coriacea LEGE 07157]
MTLSVLPLSIIVLQVLFLLVGIAIEAVVLYFKLPLTQRQSVECSTVVNLVSSIFVWLIFLILQGIIPEMIRLEVISYILFNKFYKLLFLIEVDSILMIVGIISFCVICFIEFIVIVSMQNLFSEEAESRSLMQTLQVSAVRNDPGKAVAIVTANVLSQGFLFLLLSILRFV